MKFKHLKTDRCPKCDTDVVIREEVDAFNGCINIHVNGERWESRMFVCGQVIHYIPNFQRESQSTAQQCTKSAHYKEKRERRRRALLHLVNEVLPSLNTDEEFLKDLERRIDPERYRL